jgi:putative addiction module CopG family antidote
MSMLVKAAAQQRCEMSLNVPPKFERAVLERVQSGHYDSADEVFAACLHALALWEAEQEAKLEALRRDVDVGRGELRRGEGSPAEELFERIRRRVYSGEYESAEDVLNTALAVLDEAEADDAANDTLRDAIDVGLGELDRGEGLSGEAAAEQIRADIRSITGR